MNNVVETGSGSPVGVWSGVGEGVEVAVPADTVKLTT